MNVLPKKRFLRLTPEEKSRYCGFVAGGDDHYRCFARGEEAMYQEVCKYLEPGMDRSKLLVDKIVEDWQRNNGHVVTPTQEPKTQTKVRTKRPKVKRATPEMLKIINNEKNLKLGDVKEVIKIILKDLGYK